MNNESIWKQVLKSFFPITVLMTWLHLLFHWKPLLDKAVKGEIKKESKPIPFFLACYGITTVILVLVVTGPAMTWYHAHSRLKAPYSWEFRSYFDITGDELLDSAILVANPKTYTIASKKIEEKVKSTSIEAIIDHLKDHDRIILGDQFRIASNEAEKKLKNQHLLKRYCYPLIIIATTWFLHKLFRKPNYRYYQTLSVCLYFLAFWMPIYTLLLVVVDLTKPSLIWFVIITVLFLISLATHFLFTFSQTHQIKYRRCFFAFLGWSVVHFACWLGVLAVFLVINNRPLEQPRMSKSQFFENSLESSKYHLELIKVSTIGETISHEELFMLAHAHIVYANNLTQVGKEDKAKNELLESREYIRRMILEKPNHKQSLLVNSMFNNSMGELLKLKDPPAALQHYQASLLNMEHLSKLDPNDNGNMLCTATTHEKIGNVLLVMDKREKAQLAFEQSMTITKQLVEDDPNNHDLKYLLGIGHERMGNMFNKDGNSNAALREFRCALAIYEDLAKRMPKKENYVRAPYVIHKQIGIILSSEGDWEGALRALHAGKAVVEKILNKFPDDLNLKLQMAIIDRIIGDTLFAQGDKNAAKKGFLGGIDQIGTLLSIDSQNVTWLREKAFCYRRFGDVCLAQDELQTAYSAYQNENLTWVLIASNAKEDSDFQFDIAYTFERMATVLDRMGKTSEALNMLEESLRIHKSLASLHPASAIIVGASRIVHEKIGDHYYAHQKYEDALKAYRAALNISTKTEILEPDNAEWKFSQYFYYCKILDVSLAQRDQKAALEANKNAQEIAEELVGKEPENSKWQHCLLDRLNKKGLILFGQNELTGALTPFRAAQQIGEELLEKDNQQKTSLKAKLFDIHVCIGIILHENKDLNGAMRELRLASEIGDSLTADEMVKKNLLRQAFCEVCLRIGDDLFDKEDLKGALEFCDLSLQAGESLLQQDSKNVQLCNTVSWCNVVRGRIFMKMGEQQKARMCWEKAEEIIRAAASDSKEIPVLDTYAQALLLQGRFEEARPIVEELLAKGWNNSEFLSLCEENKLLDPNSP